MRAHLTFLIMIVLSAAAPVRAQEPLTEAGALAAAIRFVRKMPSVPESMPIVTDTAAVRRELTRCTTVSGSAPTCALVDGKVVGMVLVEMRPPQWALVEFREYQVMRRVCPIGDEFPEPRPGYLRGQTWSMVYADGRWTWDGKGRGWVC